MIRELTQVQRERMEDELLRMTDDEQFELLDDRVKNQLYAKMAESLYEDDLDELVAQMVCSGFTSLDVPSWVERRWDDLLKRELPRHADAIRQRYEDDHFEVFDDEG